MEYKRKIGTKTMKNQNLAGIITKVCQLSLGVCFDCITLLLNIPPRDVISVLFDTLHLQF